jgi:signal transduction histidine kinase
MSASAGLGLAGMRERAARIGADAQVRSGRDRGTTVILRVAVAGARDAIQMPGADT